MLLFPGRDSIRALFIAIPLLLTALPLSAQSARIELSAAIVEASNDFLSSLNTAQREKASFSFDDEERLNWHFIPRARQGIPLKELNPRQLLSARTLLQTLLSAKGFQKAENVRDLENVLAELETNGSFSRDPELYYLSVFGVPEMQGRWAVSYEGHHLAFNWTFTKAAGIASTPQFFGSNPAEVRTGAKQGIRVLAVEEDLGRRLLNSLSPSQLESALIPGEAPRDIFTGAEKQVTALDDVGIAYGQLDDAQQNMLIAIISEVAAAQADEIARQRMQIIRDEGLDQIRFAWIGGRQQGVGHYYRIQGRSFLIEYDNTQNDANHIHLVWRDFNCDFCRDLIRMHYDAVAAEHGQGHTH